MNHHYHRFSLLRRVLAWGILLMLAPHSALCEPHTREEVRNMYNLLYEKPTRTPYEQVPDVETFSPGQLTGAAQAQALACVQFARYLAYLPYDIELDAQLAENAQAAALLLAATDELSHTPIQPEGMPDSLYETAKSAASQSNIASFNWFVDDMLPLSIRHFMLDEADYNLPVLGHRRWILSPRLQKTGFGLANSAIGISYAAMYVMDFSGEPVEYEAIAWPSEGAFPSEWMSAQMPWSLSLNPQAFDLEASSPSVYLREAASGAEFTFALPSSEIGAQYFAISHDAYGEGSCVIFRPDLAAAGLNGYEQNQIWRVRVDGLVTPSGAVTSIEYAVEIISLAPIEAAAVEIEPRSLQLAPGESAPLAAQVIPAWADDIRVAYASSDPTVATVDETGLVTAIAPGTCAIRAAAANGEADECAVVVTE